MTHFYKKYKTPFFGRFCPLLVIFAQRGLFTHKPTWVMTTMLNFRKSECANSKRTSGQIEGRADPEPSSHSQRSKRKKRPFRSLSWPFLPKIYTNKPFQQKLIQHFGVIMVLYTQTKITKITKILSTDFETKTQGPFCTILSHLPQF